MHQTACTVMRAHSAQRTEECSRRNTKQANRKLVIMQKRDGNNNATNKKRHSVLSNVFFAAAVRNHAHLATVNETVPAGCLASPSNMRYFIFETHAFQNWLSGWHCFIYLFIRIWIDLNQLIVTTWLLWLWSCTFSKHKTHKNPHTLSFLYP